MTIDFRQGPVDGATVDYPSNRIPKAIEVLLRGCGATGFRTAIYLYSKTQRHYRYIYSSEDVMGINETIDFAAVGWMKLEGLKKDGGVWQMWKPINNG